MDPMHDVKVKDIKIDGNTLIVRYENLREDFFKQDGTPYYDFDTLTIKYYDDWNELTLEMNINKIKHGKYLKTKWHSIYISLDPIKVIYEWSD